MTPADTILVTGASRGIGLATCQRLAATGHSVVGIARHPPEDGFPGNFHRADLGDREDTERVLAEIVADHAIDGLVNNVGFNRVAALGEVALEDLGRVLDLNLRTCVQCTQAVLPGMRTRGYGRIVNLGSRGALGRHGRTSYAAAKAGIVGMTRTWALELAPYGITANVVAPGPTATEMFVRNNLQGPDAEAVEARFLAEVPMKRFGRPEEIAFAICCLLQREASFITGQVLNVCGGSSIGAMPL
ncbi:MAG: SDR family oxidoreductase [Candidatus Competibacterales bacterium]|nr:SDR family oxidoreductase [Candidatus Competibacterales bacterium]